MGQSYSCKCNNEKDQKKSSELQLDNKEKCDRQKENNLQKKYLEKAEPRAKTSFIINKTLEEIINTNEAIITDFNKLSSTRQTEVNSQNKNSVLPQENGKKLEDTNSSKLVISAFSPINTKEKITSPTSQHDNISSLSSNKKKKRDINKIGLITSQKNTRKYVENLNFSQLTNNNTSKAPLEIINEYHREHSAEALFDNSPPKTSNSLNPFPGNNLNIIDNLDISIEENFNTDLASYHPIKFEKNQYYSKKTSPLNSENARITYNINPLKRKQSPSSRESKDNFQINNNSNYFLKKNGNSHLPGSDQIDISQNIITVNAEKNEVKKVKIFMQRLNATDIFSLFPEYRLLNTGEQDILYQCEILKYSPPEVYFASSYSYKYCVLFRSEFKYFKSKEAFFRLSQPLLSLPIENISSCNYLKEENDKSKGLIHLFNLVVDKKKKPSVWLEKQRKFHKKEKVTDMYNSLLNENDTSRLFQNVSKKEDKKAKKMFLLNPKDKSKEQLKKTKDKEEEEEKTDLIFAGDEEKVIKWLKIFEYVLNKK